MKHLFLFFSFMFLLCRFLFAQTECPSCDKYLGSIYDTYKITKKVNLKEDFKKWFLSNKFESSYKNHKTGLDITVPIDGLPITFGGSHESDDAWEKRESVKDDESFNIDYSTFESIYLKKATPNSRNIFLNCVKLCYENPGATSPLKIKVTADKSYVFAEFSYNYETGASIPVVTSIYASGVDEALSKSLIGQMLNTGGTTLKMPWNNQGETEATITVNTTRGSKQGRIDKPNAVIQLSYQYETYEKQKVGTKSVYMQNPGCSNCGCAGRPCYGGNGATVVSSLQIADPNNWFTNARWVPKNSNAFVNVLPADYFFGLPPSSPRATSDSATVVGLVTHGWGPGFDGDFVVDVYTRRSILTTATKDVRLVNNVAYFSLSKAVQNAILIIKDVKYELNDKLKDEELVKSFKVVDNGVENVYEIEFSNG